MDTTIFQELEDDRVLLRPLQSIDFEYLKPFSLYEGDLWNFSITSAAGEDNLRKYIDKAFQGREVGLEYPFIVFDKLTKQYAGSTRFCDIQPFHKSLQLGYTWYGKAFQGTGVNKHCKYLLLEYAFDQLGMERVEFRAHLENERSIRAMKSIGCTEEGVLRSHVVGSTGQRRNSIILSILQKEWHAGIREMLRQKVYGQ